MPFTISHTAAVLPFSRWLARGHLLSAVVIGSMVPDFGMFFPWHLERAQTHGVWALLTFCLPVGLAAYWWFQYLVKMPLIEVLPAGAHGRWRGMEQPADIRNPWQWIRAAVGVVAGAVTHLVWDGFTHEGARGVRMIPRLSNPVLQWGTHRLAGARLLQDGSSLLGLILIALALGYALRPGPSIPESERRLQAWERHGWVLAYVMAAALMTFVLGLVAWLTWGLRETVVIVVVQMAYASVRGTTLALLIVSLALRRRLGAYP